MSAIQHLILPKASDVGFPVQRLLRRPKSSRSVRSYFSITWAGHSRARGRRATCGRIHIGLATVTYLYSGAMMHRDSLGTSSASTGRDQSDGGRTRSSIRNGCRPIFEPTELRCRVFKSGWRCRPSARKWNQRFTTTGGSVARIRA